MNNSYYNTLQKLRYKITELQAYFAFILLDLSTKVGVSSVHKYPPVPEYVKRDDAKKL